VKIQVGAVKGKAELQLRPVCSRAPLPVPAAVALLGASRPLVVPSAGGTWPGRPFMARKTSLNDS